jgi:hypothetical protein
MRPDYLFAKLPEDLVKVILQSSMGTWPNEGSERRRKGRGRPQITNECKERRLRRLASVNLFEITRSVEATWMERCCGKTGVYANTLPQNPFTWRII